MRIVCAGGGPAGLYFALLTKQAQPSHDVVVLERRSPGKAGGWGVTVWDDLLDDLHSTDAVVGARIAEAARKWPGLVVDRAGDRVSFDGHCYGISRATVLDILTERAVSVGVDVRFDTDAVESGELDGADIVVACDGVHSALRAHAAESFGTTVEQGGTRFVWLGTPKVFDKFTFAFVPSPSGWIWCYAYAFDAHTSTFIVECTHATWHALGFDRMPADACLGTLQRLFTDQLDGHPLLADSAGDGKSGPLPWTSFPTVTNARWSTGNVVLMGDAAHTTHFSIGSGMRLALQDAICLAGQLQAHPTAADALAGYEKSRREALIGPYTEARFSQRWFEDFDRYADLPARALCDLLSARRDPMMTRIPPHLYWRIHRAIDSNSFTRTLRHRIGPAARTFYGKYSHR